MGGTHAVAVTQVSSTVIVSPVGLPGPRGAGFQLLGRLPAGTLPSEFPTSPPPGRGDTWSVGGSAFYTWTGTLWEATLEIGTTPTFSQVFALDDAVTTLSVVAQHNFSTTAVTVECQLLPSGRLVAASVMTLSNNAVAVSLTTSGGWNDTSLRVQVRP